MEPKFSPFAFFFLFSLLYSYTISSDSSTEKQKPFEFLNHLHKCRKGDKVQGLIELKKYLEKFGYLNYPHSLNGTHVDDDEFDDHLELAIKNYQLNYHLKTTGTLDSVTVTKMMMPRCGGPDITNGTTSMRSAKKKHNHGFNSLHTISHYSFFEGTPKWRASKTHLTYAFPLGAQAHVLGPSCTRAFQKWASVTHFTFEEIPNYDVAAIKISFQIGDHGDGLDPFDGPHGTLAHAFAPEDGRLHFDGEDLWATSPIPEAYDIETVALHEIGHILGLDHSSVADAIMYPILPFGAAKGLHGDDVRGIQALYGA